MTDVEACKACEARTAAGFEGQCPACAGERARDEMAAEREQVARVQAIGAAITYTRAAVVQHADACQARADGGRCEAAGEMPFDPSCLHCGRDIYGDREHCTTCGTKSVTRGPNGTDEVPALRWDPELVGDTAGGLQLRGWYVCRVCGATTLSKHRSRPVGSSAAFKISKGGRSLDCGGVRLRAESAPGVVELMTRIARLPDLETAIAAIAGAMADLEIDDQTRLERITRALERVPT